MTFQIWASLSMFYTMWHYFFHVRLSLPPTHMTAQKTCQACGHELPSEARFCTGCGQRFFQEPQEESRSKEILNLRILYVMAGLLVLAVLFPPWESPPGDPPAYLGMHFILSPPEPEAVVSRILQTVELVTLAIGGMYLAWLFRDKPQGTSD